MIKTKFPFGKKHKLKNKKEISTIFEKGKSLSFSDIKIKYFVVFEHNSKVQKWAISIPKKYIKKAVERNKIRRKIREYLRLNINKLDNYNNFNIKILIIYTSKKHDNFKSIKKQITTVIDYMGKEILILNKSQGI